MTSPPVSVVIATRNRPEMVREAIDAALGQEYAGPIEVVVVADQSEPDRDLERRAVGREVRVVVNRRSPGLAGARNTGIEEASHDLVAFCDDDDYWLPAKLRLQVDALTSRPGAVLCATGIRVQYDGDEFDRVLDTTEVPVGALLRDRHTELHPSTFLVRREQLEQVGYVDEQVPGGFGEDYDFLLRCSRPHPVVNVPTPLTVVRWGKQSFFFRRWQTMAEGLGWLLDRHPDFETSPRGSARLRGQIAFAESAMGNRRTSARWALGALRRNPVEPRAYLALAVSSGAVKPDRVMELLHRRGKGI